LSVVRGIYVLTDPDLIPDEALQDRVRAAVEGGAGIVQYRDKRPGRAGHRARAGVLRALTRELGAMLIVNDDPQLAAEIDADGVHLGRDDPDIIRARRTVGDRLIGISCYNELDRAVSARDRGADYVAFGSFFPSPTKTATVRATPSLLRRARDVLGIPVVAIGGVTPENGAELLAAGADALAVASAVFGAEDPRAAARRFQSIISSEHQS